MTIIVTGGAGFIGSNFIFHMLKEHPDYRIICLDKLTYAGNLSTLAPVMDNPNFRFVKADICDREAVEKLFEEEHPDIVVNFAAESHVTAQLRIQVYSLKQIFSVLKHLWTLAVSMASLVIIRYQPMRFTVICRLTDLICSLQRKHRYTHHHLTVHQRQVQIYLFLHITEPLACL